MPKPDMIPTNAVLSRNFLRGQDSRKLDGWGPIWTRCQIQAAYPETI